MKTRVLHCIGYIKTSITFDELKLEIAIIVGNLDGMAPVFLFFGGFFDIFNFDRSHPITSLHIHVIL